LPSVMVEERAGMKISWVAINQCPSAF
jgi:hypothetical protein